MDLCFGWYFESKDDENQSLGCGPETSIARSKNYAEQFHLSLDETILNPVFLAKVSNNFLGQVNNSLFYKLQVWQLVALHKTKRPLSRIGTEKLKV